MSEDNQDKSEIPKLFTHKLFTGQVTCTLVSITHRYSTMVPRMTSARMEGVPSNMFEDVKKKYVK